MLFVKEPDGEMHSRAAVQRWKPAYGGWTLADVQRFWLALKREKGVWHAVSSDGGDVAQLAQLHPDGSYEMRPPRMALETGRATRRMTIAPGTGQPLPPELRYGGALMYFYVYDTSARPNRPARPVTRETS
jgi:hypothetical protein